MLKKPELLIGILLVLLISAFVFHEIRLRSLEQELGPGSVELLEEQVWLSLELPQLKVEGNYILFNESSRRLSLPMTFVFPVDSAHRKPRNIQVKHKIQDLNYTWQDSATITFVLTLEPRSREVVIVSYMQELLGNRAAYRMGTAPAWDKPLEKAIYEIRVPSEILELTLNYPPDQVRDVPPHKHYLITRTHFIPEKDLILEWSAPSAQK